VCEITNPGTFNLGKPIKGGLNDPALGTADKRSTCVTCKNTYAGSATINDCPGHFGHVQVRAGDDGGARRGRGERVGRARAAAHDSSSGRRRREAAGSRRRALGARGARAAAGRAAPARPPAAPPPSRPRPPPLASR